MQAIARLQLRAGKADEHITEMLREIALRGETETWRQWARTRQRPHGRLAPLSAPPW